MSRIEHDFLGDLEIPDDVYYGVQSLRGKENFHITEHSMNEDEYFIKAFAQVKKAAARTNKELGTIPANVADALIYACDQLLEGKYRDQFVTDWPARSWVSRRAPRSRCRRTTTRTSASPRTIRTRPLCTSRCITALKTS